MRRNGSRRWKSERCRRDPRGSRADVFAIAAVENKTFSTSGDYERSVVRDGVRYHHILDPRSGRPASECLSLIHI